MREEIQELLAAPPMLHCGADYNDIDGPGLTLWTVEPPFLAYLETAVGPGTRTLETGCGLTTITFAILGCEHWCISYSPHEQERVREYLRSRSISAARLRFAAGGSQDLLPGIPVPAGSLDFALIDGAHWFPMPCVDFFYVNRLLRVGGLLAVDDADIPSVAILHRFLSGEPEWKLEVLVGKTSVFRKLEDKIIRRDWLDQAFNRTYPDLSYLGSEP